MTPEPISDERLAEIEREWLQPCGNCDAGLPMLCSCPDDDPRTVIDRLLAEVVRLRASLTALRVLCDEAGRSGSQAVWCSRVRTALSAPLTATGPSDEPCDQNPGQWLQGSSMPLIVDLGDDHLIPVEYPAAAGGTS